MTFDVVVIGSTNADLIVQVDRIPRPGETVLASGLARACGGKGANQAVAAARAGAGVAFVGAVGDDADGTLLRGALAAAGVDVAALREFEGPSGTAVVTVDAHGENSIVVAPGANARLTELDAGARARIAGARVLLAQLETPIACVAEAALAARAARVPVVLNAAPSGPLTVGYAGALPIDVLVVNEHEAEDLTGLGDTTATARALLDWAERVVVTLGAAGALIAERGRPDVTVPAPAARVVDTTAAGDTFCGVLAASLARGATLAAAVRRASAAGSLAVERHGAVPSIPSAAEIAARHAAAYGDDPEVST